MEHSYIQWTVSFTCPEFDLPATVVAYPVRVALHTNNKQLIVNCPRCQQLHTLDIPE